MLFAFAAIYLSLPIILLIFPSKKIGSYGYITPRSTSSQKAWDDAQKYSGKLSAISATLSLAILLISCYTLGTELSALISFSFWAISCFVMIGLTEQHLKKFKQ